jgi:hypothetical protein
MNGYNQPAPEHIMWLSRIAEHLLGNYTKLLD